MKSSAAYGLVAAVAFAVALPFLGGEFLWDDTLYLEKWILATPSLLDHFVPREAGFPYYKPLPSILAWASVAIAGPDPVLAHAIGLVLHAVAAAGVFAAARELLRGPARDVAAVVAAVLYAVWPVHAEALGWVSARSELLLAALLPWILVLHGRARVSGAAPAALFFLALLSKETALVFPVVLIAASLLAPRPEGERPRALALWGPYAVAIAVYLLLRKNAVAPRDGIGAVVAERLAPETLVEGLRAWGFYVRELLLLGDGAPFLLHVPGGALSWTCAAGGILAAAAALAWWRRTRDGLPLLAWLWTAAFLAPALLIVAQPITTTPVAIRYLTVPAIGLALAAGWAVARWNPRAPRATALLALGACLLGGILLQVRGVPWRSDRALWDRARRDEPASMLVHVQLSRIASARGERDSAIQHARIAAWGPVEGVETRRHAALVSLAWLYLADGELDGARTALREAAGLKASPESLADARNLSVLLSLVEAGPGATTLRRDELRRQLDALESAAAQDGLAYMPRVLLGLYAEGLGDPVDARRWYERARNVAHAASVEWRFAEDRRLAAERRIREESDPVRAAYFGARLAEEEGRWDVAEGRWREAIALEPAREELHLALADLLARRNRVPEAIATLEALPPSGSPVAPFNLGVYRQAHGDLRGAIQAYDDAIARAPRWPKPRLHRALALDAIGNRAEARAAFEAFLRDFPGEPGAAVARRYLAAAR